MVEIENCIFRDNVSTTDGGAVWTYYGYPRITGSRFLNNTAGRGGALAADEGDFVLRDCLFSGNSATDGGAIWAQVAYMDTISSCTFVANEAPIGSGISHGGYFGATLVLDHCIIADGLGGEAYAWDGTSALEISCTNIHGNAGGDWVGNIADLAGVNGNLSANPLFCGDQNPEEPFSIAGESPCAPDNNPDCGLIGALPVGCSVTGIPAMARPLHLYQNYPNPFNPATTIAFELAMPATVTLKILDTSGRLVRVLIQEEMMAAGFRETTWNGTDTSGRIMAAGVYFCQLQADGFRDIGRMTLLK
jgi:predicted outer membrane repeat protein